MVDWQQGTPEASEFMHEFKMNLFQDEIFVFTPKGDLIQLPAGSTPVDFAFALHTEIGLHCSGAKVNGRMVQLNHELRSGQWVDILTTPNKTPNPEWLNVVKTAKARSIIRRWIKRQHYEESKELGIDMIAKIEKQLDAKISNKDREKLIRKYHQRDWDQFIISLGSGDVSLHSVQNYFGLLPQKKPDKHTLDHKAPVSVSIQGVENLLVSYAKCCKPLPGDEIVGYVTRGRGMVIHRSECENIKNIGENDDRLIRVKWEPKEGMLFVASIRVEAIDRKGLLTEITAAITKSNCDIRSATAIVKDGIAIDDFDVDVKDLADLYRLIKEIRNVKGIIRVERLDMRSSTGNVETK
jgi:GTP pyrophosphokinase